MDKLWDQCGLNILICTLKIHTEGHILHIILPSLNVMYLINKHTAAPEGVCCTSAGIHLFWQGCFFQADGPMMDYLLLAHPKQFAQMFIMRFFLLTQHLHIHRTMWPSAEKSPSLRSLFLCWERAFPSPFPAGIWTLPFGRGQHVVLQR